MKLKQNKPRPANACRAVGVTERKEGYGRVREGRLKERIKFKVMRRNDVIVKCLGNIQKSATSMSKEK